MASGTTLSVIVVLIVFFAMGFGLYAIAISESPTFFSETMTGTGPSGTSVSDPSSLLAWNVSNAVQLNQSNPYVEYDISGWGFTSWKYMDNGSAKSISVDTFDNTWGGIFKTNREDFEFKDENGTIRTERDDVIIYGYTGTYESHLIVPVSTLDYIYWSGVGPPSVNLSEPLTFTLYNSKTSLEVTFSFNKTGYVYPSNALAAQGLYVSIKQDFSDRRTSINLLTFIGGLFTFSLSGIPYPISTFVSFIWYGCVGALTYVVISIVRSFIPFLTGE